MLIKSEKGILYYSLGTRQWLRKLMKMREKKGGKNNIDS